MLEHNYNLERIYTNLFLLTTDKCIQEVSLKT